MDHVHAIIRTMHRHCIHDSSTTAGTGAVGALYSAGSISRPNVGLPLARLRRQSASALPKPMYGVHLTGTRGTSKLHERHPDTFQCFSTHFRPSSACRLIGRHLVYSCSLSRVPAKRLPWHPSRHLAAPVCVPSLRPHRSAVHRLIRLHSANSAANIRMCIQIEPSTCIALSPAQGSRHLHFHCQPSTVKSSTPDMDSPVTSRLLSRGCFGDSCVNERL